MYSGHLDNYLFFYIEWSYNYKERIIQKEADFRIHLIRKLVKMYPLYFITSLSVSVNRSKYIYCI